MHHSIDKNYDPHFNLPMIMPCEMAWKLMSDTYKQYDKLMKLAAGNMAKLPIRIEKDGPTLISEADEAYYMYFRKNRLCMTAYHFDILTKVRKTMCESDIQLVKMKMEYSDKQCSLDCVMHKVDPVICDLESEGIKMFEELRHANSITLEELDNHISMFDLETVADVVVYEDSRFLHTFSVQDMLKLLLPVRSRGVTYEQCIELNRIPMLLCQVTNEFRYCPGIKVSNDVIKFMSSSYCRSIVDRFSLFGIMRKEFKLRQLFQRAKDTIDSGMDWRLQLMALCNLYFPIGFPVEGSRARIYTTSSEKANLYHSMSSKLWITQNEDCSGDEIQGSYSAIIGAKARQLYSEIGYSFVTYFCEDLGLELDAYDGLPGPYVKDFLKGRDPDRIYSHASMFNTMGGTIVLSYGIILPWSENIVYKEYRQRIKIVEPLHQEGVYGFDGWIAYEGDEDCIHLSGHSGDIRHKFVLELEDLVEEFYGPLRDQGFCYYKASLTYDG